MIKVAGDADIVVMAAAPADFRPASIAQQKIKKTDSGTPEPIVYRAPYEYSVPGAAKDFSPQFEPEKT